jgi:hypothetical protein
MRPGGHGKEAMVDWLDTLQTLVGMAIVVAVAAASVFTYGSRIGVWFTQLLSEDRRLFWAAVGLACWTVIVGVVAWAVSFLVYVAYIGGQPGTPSGWAAAASIGLLLASPAVAILAGIPWLVLVGLVRVVRWRSRTSEGREHSE